VQRKLDLISNLRYNWRLVDHLQRLVILLRLSCVRTDKGCTQEKTWKANFGSDCN